jgi:hypothetical protein
MTNHAWSAYEAIPLINDVVAHRGLRWDGPAPAHPENHYEGLIPTRTKQAVYLQAWVVAFDMGLCPNTPNTKPSVLISKLIEAFKLDPKGLAEVSDAIAMARSVGARVATPPITD